MKKKYVFISVWITYFIDLLSLIIAQQFKNPVLMWTCIISFC